jgi:hypothetical protein
MIQLNLKTISLILGALLILIVLIRSAFYGFMRHRYCRLQGHDLTEKCRCQRCRKHYHEYLKVENRTEREDPGAMHLDSNFQPYTYYEIEEYLECKRCGERTKYRTYTQV